MANEWPAASHSIEAARAFLRSCGARRVVVASHNDVDGLAASLIMVRAVAASGGTAEPLPARRGEHVHQDAMRTRIRAKSPDALIVVDMGSRPGRILDGMPTLVIDHHDAAGGVPAGALIVNGYDREPVAPSSVLAYAVCADVPGIQASAWVAALGAIADLGTAAPFASLIGIEARGSAWSKAVSLLNAGRRAAEDDAMTPLNVLQRATSVHEIAKGLIPGVERLEGYRRAVQAEVARCSRVPPQILGPVALIRFSSGAQVHPLIAARWSARLAPKVVMAANEGFLPGRVNFAVRSATDVNLVHWLKGLRFKPSPEAEYANGHPRATGGSLPKDEFDAFVSVLRDDVVAEAAIVGPKDGSSRRSP